MRKCKCKKCGVTFLEDDSNPNVHYSIPEEICRSCKIYAEKKVGDWYQSKDGQYHEKK